MIEWIRNRLAGPEVAVFHRFHAPPYGGGNQFLLALVARLRRRGIDIREASRVTRRTRACLFNSINFDPGWLKSLDGSACHKVHRIDGPIGTYRGTDNEVDRRIWKMNQDFADVTILQSRYSLEAHAALELDFRSPVVIPNAVDPALFHTLGRTPWDPARKTRLVSTSWSDNPAKGASTYKWIEDHLDWTRFEYTFIGRSPVKFDRIRTLEPLPSRPLAEELRAHDVYVTASRNDACSNALLEALACGLPALAVRSGGNPELVKDGGALFDGTDDVLDKLGEIVTDYGRKQSLIQLASLDDVADRYLSVLLPALPADRDATPAVASAPDRSRSGGA